METIRLREDIAKLTAYSPYRVLAGFMDEPHLQQLAASAIAVMTEEEKRLLRDAHARAQGAASLLQQEDFSRVVIGPVGAKHDGYLDKVKATESFRHAYGQRPYQFAVVDGRLLCAFQPHVRLAYEIPPPDDPDEVLAYCIPEKFPYTVTYVVTQGPGGIRVQASSLSPNFAFEGANVAQDGVLLHVGPNKNWVQVAHVEDRYYLKNGYHRVFSLLQRKVNEIPCVLFEAKDWADVGMGPHAPIFFNGTYLAGLHRPPLLKDFFGDPAIEVPLRQSVKVLDFRIGFESFGVPL